ncbi:alpha-galactosidase [Planctomycetota bacterium]
MKKSTKKIMNLDFENPEHGKPYELVFSRKVTVFGPCKPGDPVPKKDQLAECPERLKIGKASLSAKQATMKDGNLDLGRLFKKHTLKMTGYAFIPFRAVRAGQYQVGVGADWWFEAWVDGIPILTSLKSGNSVHPPAREDWVATVALDAGKHLLAVRVLSGSAGMTLDAGVPRFTQTEAYRLRTGSTINVMRPFKVVFIGAGSMFLQGLFTDILTIPGADKGEIALVDIDRNRLKLAEKICGRINGNLEKNWKITSSTDRRRVLKGADYVIHCIEAPGSRRAEYEIPLKYGIDQAVGDTLGPGGLFKGMRNVPIFLSILKDVEELCPDAQVLNYTNPMSILCLSSQRATSVKVIGLCHSVQNTSNLLARWCGVPYHKLSWKCAGINHMNWFTELSHKGKDMYPQLKERVLENNEFPGEEVVRRDLMKHFGYFSTESSKHISEYVPYYRKRKDLLKTYCGQDFGERKKYFAREYSRKHKSRDQSWHKQLAGQADMPTHRGVEYASHIVEGMETNNPFVVHGSVKNESLITNLPQNGVVEVACLVDRSGIQPVRYGSLPPQCAALCDSNMRFIDVAAKACIERSMESAVHALLLDPLTSAVCSPSEIKKMTEELFKAEKEYLKGYK